MKILTSMNVLIVWTLLMLRQPLGKLQLAAEAPGGRYDGMKLINQIWQLRLEHTSENTSNWSCSYMWQVQCLAKAPTSVD